MELWSPQHLKTLIPSILIMLALSTAGFFLLGKKSLKIRILPIQIISGILIILELGKQIISFQNGYDLYHIPLHYCSLFLFVLPLMAFYSGKHKQVVYGMAAGICASLFLLMLIYPSLIYSGSDIDDFFKRYMAMHTVAFHNLVMLAFLLIVALKVHTPQKGERKAIVLFMCGFCAISGTMAQVLKTNYANFYSCNIPPLENLRLQIQAVLGYWPTQILYVLIVSLLTVLFTLMSYQFYLLLHKAVNGKKAAQTV